MNKPSFLLILCFSASAASAADSLLPSMPADAVQQAAAGNVRLVVWELPNGNGIEVQAVKADSHATLSERIVLGPKPPDGDEPLLGTTQTRPAVAGFTGSDDATFFVAWHAEILETGTGTSFGTEVVGQRVVVDTVTGDINAGPLIRVSHVDDDADETAASETRSAPVVVASETEDEFLVLWTHWPNGKTLHGSPPVSNDDYFIYAQEIRKDGGLIGLPGQLDALTAPQGDDGLPVRESVNPIFLAALPLADEAGYLLAWSDPAQEDGGEDLAQLYTKFLPAAISDTDIATRNGIGDATSTTKGTGRIALARLPAGDGYLLAYEDTRGLAPLRGIRLGDDGRATGNDFHLLDEMNGGDDTFLSPVLVSSTAEGRILLYAAVGDHSIAGDVPVEELTPQTMRLVRRVVNPTDPAFDRIVEDFDTVSDEYPLVNIFFAAQAHAAAALPDGRGAVSFAAKAAKQEIGIHEFGFATEPSPPPSPPPSRPIADNNGGGGAMFVLLAFLVLLRVARKVSARRRAAAGMLLALAAAANAAPPDIELLHTAKEGADCYRAVMYREVSEIRLANSYNKTPIPPGTAVEIVDLPTGWNAEVVTEKKYQWLRLHPAPFDAVSGISIGRVCLKFPAITTAAQDMPYTYHLVATDSRIMATARADDGVSDAELRAMIKRGERLKQGDVPIKPKQLDESVKTLKRAKELFD